jgi:hypothetical protein
MNRKLGAWFVPDSTSVGTIAAIFLEIYSLNRRKSAKERSSSKAMRQLGTSSDFKASYLAARSSLRSTEPTNQPAH